jgi:D-alanine-D-alanine ligase
MVVEKVPVGECKLGWPLIIKPALQDASVGIDQNSVVTSQRQLEDRVGYILRKYGPPVLVERFVCGREFNVSLIEKPDPACAGATVTPIQAASTLTTLPVSEIQFLDSDSPNFWPLVTYDAKWHPDSRDFKATPPRFPSDLRPEFVSEMTSIARRTFRLIGCRDYARIDFRTDTEGKPYVLEVNPNPCMSPLAGLASSLEHAGQTHASFVVSLVHMALARKTATRHTRALLDGALPKLIPNAAIT